MKDISASSWDRRAFMLMNVLTPTGPRPSTLKSENWSVLQLFNKHLTENIRPHNTHN
jgi:hypothetical protein